MLITPRVASVAATRCCGESVHATKKRSSGWTGARPAAGGLRASLPSNVQLDRYGKPALFDGWNVRKETS